MVIWRDSDGDSDGDSSSSYSSDDEESTNFRLKPDWRAHQLLLASRGFRLDTARDVKRHYEAYWARNPEALRCGSAEYQRACSLDSNTLCSDPGLVCVHRCYAQLLVALTATA
jgi:hypothetical protein